MDDPEAVRLRERAADLSQDVNDAPRRQCAVASNELLEIDAVEELHRVIEHAVRRPPVVVNRHGVRVREHRGELYFPLEALKIHYARPGGRRQLDGGRAPQHRVARPIDHTHRALADLLVEGVLPETPRALRLTAQPVHHVGCDDARDEAQDCPARREERGDETRRPWSSKHDSVGDERAGRRPGR